MTRNFQLFLLTLFTILLSTTTSAQTDPEQEERWFQTEIIIFEGPKINHTESQELWSDDPGLPDYEAVIELVSLTDAETAETPTSDGAANERVALTPDTTDSSAAPLSEQPYQLLPNSELTLTALTERLNNSAEYGTLLHIAWRQPVLEKDAAKKIHLQVPWETDQPQSKTFSSMPPIVNVSELMPPPEMMPEVMEAPLLLTAQEMHDTTTTYPENALDGTIKLHLGRYLHVEADLLYRTRPTAPVTDNTFLMRMDETKPAPTLFRMQQKRRMRSEELHYFDHPMFGMLVLITPYELPEPEPEITLEPAPAANQKSDASATQTEEQSRSGTQ